MPTVYNGKQSPLEDFAINGNPLYLGSGREKLIGQNIYNNVNASNRYSQTHTRAVADQKTPHYGKGTGQFLDINNYAAGSDWDIYGNSANGIGSGRNPAFANNYGTWGYDNTHSYMHPDTSKNIGQVII